MMGFIRSGLAVLATLAVTALVGPVAAVAADPAQETWRFAIEEIQGSVQEAYALKFKELVERKSDGEIAVTIYPYGQIGNTDEVTELVVAEVIQFANASPGHLGTIVPESQVFSIPYLLSDNPEVNKKVLSGSDVIYDTLNGKLEDKGLKLLTMYPEGDMVWTANKPIRTPQDFENFKMRTMVSPMLLEAYRAFGGAPTPLPYAEVYGALQLNMIDGQVNPVFAIEEMGFYEVSDYMIWTGEQQFTTTVITNNDWYESLPEDQRTLIDETIAELNDYIYDLQEQYNEERLKIIKQKKPDLKMIHLTEEEQAAFEARARAAEDRFISMLGPDGRKIYENLTAEIERTEKAMETADTEG